MKKILIVDDEPISLDLLETMLEPVGCEIIKTTDGRMTRHLIKTENPDLLITDINMTDTDGMEIILEIRKAHPNLPIIVVSTADKLILEVTIELGAKAYIYKPINSEKLLNVVNRYL